MFARSTAAQSDGGGGGARINGANQWCAAIHRVRVVYVKETRHCVL